MNISLFDILKKTMSNIWRMKVHVIPHMIDRVDKKKKAISLIVAWHSRQKGKTCDWLCVGEYYYNIPNIHTTAVVNVITRGYFLGTSSMVLWF